MIRLPNPAHAALQARAQQAGEPLASTAAGLLRTVLKDSETATSRGAAAYRLASPPRATHQSLCRELGIAASDIAELSESRGYEHGERYAELV
jgi:hypothetical protein